MDQLDREKINLYLLHKQHLLKQSRINSIVQTAGDLCGLHATCPTTPYLSLFARMNQFSKSDLKREVEINKSLVRIRSIRSTLHLIPFEKNTLVFAATKAQLNRRSEKYIQHLGMTLEEFNSIAEKIIITLTGRGLTANEIKKETGNSKYTSHVINILCDEGTIVRGMINGSWKSNIHRYFRFEDFYSESDISNISKEVAFEYLVMDYIKSYGPVTMEDIIWWSGLNKQTVRQVIENKKKELENLNIEGYPENFLMLKSDFDSLLQTAISGNLNVLFLPAMDPFIMGYKVRQRFIDDAESDFVYDRFGNATPTIILDGTIIGIWDLDDQKNILKFYIFENQEDKIFEEIIKEGIKTGEFYCEREIDILEIRETTPVKNLTVGSFMSPLKKE